jgi:hypothetical protein
MRLSQYGFEVIDPSEATTDDLPVLLISVDVQCRDSSFSVYLYHINNDRTEHDAFHFENQSPDVAALDFSYLIADLIRSRWSQLDEPLPSESRGSLHIQADTLTFPVLGGYLLGWRFGFVINLPRSFKFDFDIGYRFGYHFMERSVTETTLLTGEFSSTYSFILSRYRQRGQLLDRLGLDVGARVVFGFATTGDDDEPNLYQNFIITASLD